MATLESMPLQGAPNQNLPANAAFFCKAAIKGAIPNNVKRLLATFLRRFGLPPRRLRNLLAFEGQFDLKVEDKILHLTLTNGWIEQDLFWKGIEGYDRISLAIWIAAAKRARTIVDVGANTGLYALLAKTVNPSANVFGFEPEPNFNRIFAANCTLNHFDIHIAASALSNFTGSATFYISPEQGGNVYSSSLLKSHYYAHQSVTPQELPVAVTTFDKFAAESNVTEVDLVKIDAEGSDFEVLLGMQDALDKCHPDILIEIQSDEIGERIMSVLTPEHYVYFCLDEEHGPVRVQKIARGPHLNFFVCKPATAEALHL